MSGKLFDNKRRIHAAKILQKNSKKNAEGEPSTESLVGHEMINPKNVKKTEAALRNQYSIIREDVVKLKEDLVKGYDLARLWVGSKSVVRDFLKSK